MGDLYLGEYMPEYSFVCRDCENRFSLVLSYKQYDSGRFSCDKCNSICLDRDYSTDLSNISGSVKKSDSELKTIGDLANRNRDKMSDDQKEHLYRKHNEYKLNKPNDPLPKGWNRVKKTSKPNWKKLGGK